MNVTLERATPPDHDELLALVRDYHAFEGVSLADAARSKAVGELLRADTLGRVWFISEAQRRIGYAAVCFGFSLAFAGRDAFLDELYIVPAARGRGCGRAALELVIAATVSCGVGALHLEVARTNARAHALYAALGFEDRASFHLMSLRLTGRQP